MKELYATKQDLILGIIITLIISFLLISILLFSSKREIIHYIITFSVITILIIILIFEYLSYKGKFPLYRIKD